MPCDDKNLETEQAKKCANQSRSELFGPVYGVGQQIKDIKLVFTFFHKHVINIKTLI